MSYISHVSQDEENFIIKIENVDVSDKKISVKPLENKIIVKLADQTLNFNSPKIDTKKVSGYLEDKILTIKAKLKHREKPKELEKKKQEELEDIEEKLRKEQKERKKLEEEINKKNKEMVDLKSKYDRCLRTIADFDNARKIWERKEKEIKEYGARDVMLNLLPLLDTYNAAIASYKDKNLSAESMEIFEGMKKIYDSLIHTLREQGLSEIPSVGKNFDPYYHEVVVWEETDKFPEGIIIEEFQKGYKYKDMLLRPSKVKVAKSKSK